MALSSTGLPRTSRYAWETNKRPSTCQNLPARFSKNPFFVRNAPHPSKVRHIKGLLDYPVCTVLDSGYNEHNPKRSNPFFKDCLEKPLRIPSKNEKFVPGIGIVNTQPEWVQMLQEFSRKLKFKADNPITTNENNIAKLPIKSPNLQPASREQMLPSRMSDRCSSRANTRLGTRQQTRQHSRPASMLRTMEENYVRQACLSVNEKPASQQNNDLSNMKYLENEAYVFDLLSQILQTNSIDDIKYWFLQAPSKEKEVVLEMVRAIATTNRDFRQGMNHLQQMKEASLTRDNNMEDDYEQNILYHETSLNLQDKNKYEKEQNHKTLAKSNKTSQPIADAPNTDRDRSSRQSVRSIQSLCDSLLPRVSEEDAEIEEIRSKLATRSGKVQVFNKR